MATPKEPIDAPPAPKGQGTATKPPPKPKEERTYFLVNPSGTIHAVDYEHAKWRLASPGWRSATADEVAKLNKAGGNQVHDKPIAPRWTAEPEALAEPDEAAEVQGSGGAGEK